MTHFIEYFILFHPQKDPFRVVPGPINQFYVESICIIYGKHYIAFLSNNIFKNIGE